MKTLLLRPTASPGRRHGHAAGPRRALEGRPRRLHVGAGLRRRRVVLAQGRQRRRRRGRHGVRARGHASVRRQHRRRRIHDRPHADGRASTTFDYREQAPLQVDADDVPRRGRQDRSQPHRAGYLAPGVPGTVRGLALAHKKFGKLPWKDVVDARRRARRQGFALSAALARSLNRELAGRDGAVPGVGGRVRQAGRRRVGRRRSPRLRRPRQDAPRDRRRTARTRSTRAGSPTASPRT